MSTEMHIGMFNIDGRDIEGYNPNLCKAVGRKTTVTCSCGEFKANFASMTDSVTDAKSALAQHQHRAWGLA